MKPRRRTGDDQLRFNPKRRLRDWANSAEDLAYGRALSAAVSYTGSPAHKRNPGDFKLTPPAAPRQNATLCDDAFIFQKSQAVDLLKRGALKGLVDKRSEGQFPLLIWAISDDGTVFEAELENETLGQYHGYPMPLSDPFRQIVIDGTKHR